LLSSLLEFTSLRNPWDGLQLWQEIQAQGYQGSAQTIYRYLRGLRKKRRVIWKPEVPHASLQDFSAHVAVWMFARGKTRIRVKTVTIQEGDAIAEKSVNLLK
jgi:hypothetical protein